MAFWQQAYGIDERLQRGDVGGVVGYYDTEGLEAAHFDSENLVGLIYGVTLRRSDEI